MGVIIREAGVGDVEGIYYYMKRLVDEPGLYIGFDPGEFDPPIESEVDWVEKHARSDNSVILLAVNEDVGEGERDLDDGEMVGLLNCTGGGRRGSRHETSLGVSIKEGWRGQGIGRRMMEAALEWARASGVVKRVQLEVLGENVRAQKLYEELGFEVEGVRRQSWWKFGRWMDSVIMGKLI